MDLITFISSHYAAEVIRSSIYCSGMDTSNSSEANSEWTIKVLVSIIQRPGSYPASWDIFPYGIFCRIQWASKVLMLLDVCCSYLYLDSWVVFLVHIVCEKCFTGYPLSFLHHPWRICILVAEGASADGAQDEFSESFAFALVNGALGVFEVHGRRIRDFRFGPPCISTRFISSVKDNCETYKYITRNASNFNNEKNRLFKLSFL